MECCELVLVNWMRLEASGFGCFPMATALPSSCYTTLILFRYPKAMYFNDEWELDGGGGVNLGLIQLSSKYSPGGPHKHEVPPFSNYMSV